MIDIEAKLNMNDIQRLVDGHISPTISLQFPMTCLSPEFPH